MLLSKIWFRCAAGRDPVSPVMLRPAVIGWDGQERTVDLTIQRIFSGEELLRRMKGWFTVDVDRVLEVVKKHSHPEIMNERDLVLVTQDEETEDKLIQELKDNFGDQVHLERLATDIT